MLHSLIRKWHLKGIFMLRIFSISCTVLLIGCSQFGGDLSDKDLQKIHSSKNFDTVTGKFLNQDYKNLNIQRSEQGKGFFNRLKKFKNINDAKEPHTKPSIKLPEIKPNLNQFVSHKEGLHYIWFGHSTFLVNINGKILLFDPVFSKYASPFIFFNKRFQPPVVNLEELPIIDYIIISHDHYDHLDTKSIKYFKNKNTKFIVPLGILSHLRTWGIEKDRVTELDWWNKTQDLGLTFISTPSQHFSGRKGFFTNNTLWASWVVYDEKYKIFFSGDSGYFTHFAEIGNKYGPFDITFLENGQYNTRWPTSHLFPEETIQAFKDLKGKKLMSVHWGMFDISTHNWYDPIEETTKLSSKENITHFTPKIGELVNVNDKNNTTNWWKPLVKQEM